MPYFMKKIYLFYFLGIFLFVSCSKDEEMNLGQGIKEIPIYYLELPIIPTPTVNEIKLSYKGRQLTSIIGGFAFMPSAGVPRTVFTDNVYWDVVVKGNRVTLEKKSFDKAITFSNRQELHYQGNKIVERKIFENTNTPIIHKYGYNDDLLKEEQMFRDSQFLSSRTFYYNTAGNLDSLVVSHGFYTHKSVEIFSDYDQKPNRIKGLMVLEELLPRALSQNNYLKKSVISIAESGERVLRQEQTWEPQLF